MTAPAAPPVLIHCPRCRAALGVSAGDRLHVGPVTFDRRVVLRCGGCGGLRRWCPARPGATQRIRSGAATGESGN